MKKFLLNYLLISSFIFVGVGFFNTRLSLAADNSTVMEGTDANWTAEICKIGGGCYKIDTDACKQYCGEYQLDDFVLLGIKLTKIMLGLVGTLAFGAFIYGGIRYLASAGRKDWIDKGTSAMTNAVIGLVIVFSSYLIIQFTLQTIGYIDKDGKIIERKFGNGETWDKAPQ